MVDLLDGNSWMGDIDLGEMFLNFPLDPKVRPFVGGDLTPTLDMTTIRYGKDGVAALWALGLHPIMHAILSCGERESLQEIPVTLLLRFSMRALNSTCRELWVTFRTSLGS
jgi:hypothetical protein